MFSEELKKSTLYEHTELEKELVLRIKRIRDTGEYVELLKLMYGYYKPLQDSLHPEARDNGNETDFSLRSCDFILDDLRHFDPGGNGEIPLCSNVPRDQTVASSFGIMYVTEGSTLGGQIITKMICRQLNLPPGKGFSFFNAYGDETPARWQKFKERLNLPRNDSERREMIQAAKITFSNFKMWIADK